MVAWSCFYSSSEVNISEGKLWIKEKAMRGPASHVSENGQYTDGLIRPAATVSDKLDTNLCPNNIKVFDRWFSFILGSIFIFCCFYV